MLAAGGYGSTAAFSFHGGSQPLSLQQYRTQYRTFEPKNLSYLYVSQLVEQCEAVVRKTQTYPRLIPAAQASGSPQAQGCGFNSKYLLSINSIHLFIN